MAFNIGGILSGKEDNNSDETNIKNKMVLLDLE